MGSKPEKIIWPSSFPPKKDEILSSWLIRLSHAHYQKVHTFCDIICPKVQIWNRDLDLNPPHRLLEQLEKFTIASPDMVKSTLLGSFEGILQENINHNGTNPTILPLGVFHRTRKLKGQLYCPQCLKDDGESPYYRKNWRIAFSVVCCKCGCYLCEECPHCNKPIVFFRQELGKKNSGPGMPLSYCHICRQNITEQKIKLAPNDLLDFQAQLDLALDNGYHENIQYSHLYFKGLLAIMAVLQTVSPKAASIQTLIAKMSGIVFYKENCLKGSANTFNRLAVSERSRLLLICDWLFGNRSTNFKLFINEKPSKLVYIMKEYLPIPYWIRKTIDGN